MLFFHNHTKQLERPPMSKIDEIKALNDKLNNECAKNKECAAKVKETVKKKPK